jgi:predicted RNA-binding Zn ribbon-like protein
VDPNRYPRNVDMGNGALLPTAGRDPGSRAPAPGSLRLVQALINTLSVETGTDLLDSPATAARWLTAAGLLPDGGELTGAQLRGLLDLRESIRNVLLCHAGLRDDPAASAAPTLALALALAPSRLALSVDPAGGLRLASADNDAFSRVLGTIAIAIAEATVVGTWTRLKSCPGHRCGWAFYDRSPSSRSRWCSMQVCGARAKMRAYRTRQIS